MTAYDPITTATDKPEGNRQMTPRDRLTLAIDANLPVLLMGAPGTAKTAILEAIAAERGAYLEVVIASAQDPTTILGIPMPTADRKYTEATTPGWARRIIEADASGRPTILFLDELTTVPPSVAAPLLGVVQSRRADGWTLPAGTRIVAAANPPDLAVGGWALDPAMANRWTHIDWPAPTEDWLAWARGQASTTLQLIAEYIEAVPSDLLAVPTNLSQRSGPWPSPRSWTNGARLVDASGPDPDYHLLAHTVGGRAADTFASWAAQRDVPTVEDVVTGAKSWPERSDAFLMVVDAMYQRAINDGDAHYVAAALAAGLQVANGAHQGAIVSTARRLAAAGIVAGLAPLAAAIEAVQS